MAEALLQVKDLSKAFGAVIACDGVSLAVDRRTTRAVIGPNGAGKTTLVAQIMGAIAADRGAIVFDSREITGMPPHRRSKLGLARSFQITSIFPNFSVRDNVALAVLGHEGHSFRFWRPLRRETGIFEQAGAALARVGLLPRADHRAATLAHGEQRQLELAIALAAQPRLLLLDEPMAGMAPDEVRRLIDLLAGLKSELAILLVEHDMDAVFALADCITVMAGGRVIADGSPAQVRADPAVKAAYLGDEARIGC